MLGALATQTYPAPVAIADGWSLRPIVSILSPARGTRVIVPLPAFATHAAPKPIATATGLFPTTSVRKARFVTVFVAVSRSRALSTVQTRPGLRTTVGAAKPARVGFATVAIVVGLNTSTEFGSTRRGVPPN